LSVPLNESIYCVIVLEDPSSP